MVVAPLTLPSALLLLTAAAAAQDWRPCFTASAPFARSGPAMAYDAARAEAVLFGGLVSPNVPMNDTWAWNGASWTQRSPANAPSARSQALSCYDSTRQRVVLYGGLSGAQPLGDTWEWNGTDWTQVLSAASPPTRASSALAYDGTRTLLFGGGNSAAPRNDTWSFNGTTWAQVTTANAPSPRYYHSMASNGAGELLLFGGFDPTVGYSNETWRFNGTNWSLVASAVTPPARGRATLVWDGTRYLMWGGTNSFFQNLEETWALQNGQWTQIPTQRSPSSRSGHASAWIAPQQRLLVFGTGFLQQQNLRNEVMWEFGQNLASFVRWGASVCPAIDPPWLIGTAGQPAVGTTFQAAVGSYTSVHGFLLVGLSTTSWAGGALPFDLQAFGTWPGCWLYVSPDATAYLGFGQNTPWSLTIPNAVAFVGTTLQFQGFTFGQGSFPTNLAAANAATMVVGLN